MALQKRRALDKSNKYNTNKKKKGSKKKKGNLNDRRDNLQSAKSRVVGTGTYDMD